ncbi:MAG: cytochrome ubiquinol oxidase subunit I [Alicyclobacillus sp.]|nr:cytochrome ubiquinol oxidase subunit I [Alicyclobacillus sp.]
MALGLARWQFAITTIYHFFFVPLTIGLVLLVALLETMYVIKKDDHYKQATKFWGKLFLINFAVGVVTGILQEFQFGMNWASYSRFVGDVFGAPLAVEALLAFFMESTFIGVWVFGWERLSKGVHLAAIWLVMLGTSISAFWILTANSFMQEPVGYSLRNGHAEMSSFGALLTNPQLWYEFPHVWFGACATGGFFMAGISAYLLRKGHFLELAKRSFQMAMPIALVASIVTAVLGHAQAQHLIQAQPMKMAASEALWHTSGSEAPWTVVAGIDTSSGKNSFQIQIPDALSILAYNRTHGKVEGIDELQAQYVKKYGPGNYVPPVRVTFWSFRIMVAAGILMILLALYGTWLAAGQRLGTQRRFFRLMLPAISLPYIANTSGWIMTEVGRQPWVVFGLQRTADGVSPTVSVAMVWTTLIGFTVVYGVLAAVDVFLVVKFIRQGPQEDGPDSEDPSVVSRVASL